MSGTDQLFGERAFKGGRGKKYSKFQRIDFTDDGKKQNHLELTLNAEINSSSFSQQVSASGISMHKQIKLFGKVSFGQS